ncbi:MAG: DUF4954 family protein, partial [Treponema sp.]|nr:DUF4954 family protein [Treponema sp.]
DSLALSADSKSELYIIAKNFLHRNPDKEFTLVDKSAQKKFGANIIKPAKAYKAYRRIVKYFAVRTLCDYCERNGKQWLSSEDIFKISEKPLFSEWVNVGGQILPEKKLNELFDLIKNESVNSWEKVHDFYDECQKKYEEYKVAYALNLLEKLYSRPLEEFNRKIFDGIIEDVLFANQDMYNATLISRMKDFDDEFRMQTFRNAREMDAVLGGITDNEFILDMKKETAAFEEKVKSLFSDLKSF